MIYEIKTKYTVVKTFEVKSDIEITEDNVDDFDLPTEDPNEDYWESEEEVIEITEKQKG